MASHAWSPQSLQQLSANTVLVCTRAITVQPSFAVFEGHCVDRPVLVQVRVRARGCADGSR
jgi:hypothetical protein